MSIEIVINVDLQYSNTVLWCLLLSRGTTKGRWSGLTTVTNSATSWSAASRSVPRSRRPIPSSWMTGPRNGGVLWRKVIRTLGFSLRPQRLSLSSQNNLLPQTHFCCLTRLLFHLPIIRFSYQTCRCIMLVCSTWPSLILAILKISEIC